MELASTDIVCIKSVNAGEVFKISTSSNKTFSVKKLRKLCYGCSAKLHTHMSNISHGEITFLLSKEKLFFESLQGKSVKYLVGKKLVSLYT